MNNLHEIIKLIQKQSQDIQNVVGLSGLNGLTELSESIKNMNKVSPNSIGLGGISEIAKSLITQKDKFNSQSILGSSIATQIALLQTPKNNFALAGLTSSLSQLAIQNKILSNKLASIATSQLAVTSNLTQIAMSVHQSHLNRFNTLNVAMQGISSGFLKEIVNARTWEDFDVAEEANEAIANISEETLKQISVITQKELEEFRTSVFNELTNLLSKSKTEKARQFLIDLMTIIGFLLTLYSVQQVNNDKTNKDVIIETKREFEKISNEFYRNISDSLEKLNKTRIAKTNVNLRYSTNKNSGKIGLVKKGQVVTVIEIRHKFLLISYLDFETGEPKSGFVMKKYFDLTK